MGEKLDAYNQFLEEKYVLLEELAEANQTAKDDADIAHQTAYVSADETYATEVEKLEQKTTELYDAAMLELDSETSPLPDPEVAE